MTTAVPRILEPKVSAVSKHRQTIADAMAVLCLAGLIESLMEWPSTASTVPVGASDLRSATVVKCQTAPRLTRS